MNPFQYLVVYKPFNVLCQFSPLDNKTTLSHLHLPVSKDMYPVGRLDFDSEGLLIITNDASLNQKLLLPKHNHKRTYYVQVDGAPSPADIQKLEASVNITIDGKPYKTKPAIAHRLDAHLTNQLPIRVPPIRVRKNIPTTWLQITLIEGKNRQVRKMTAAIGFPTLRLVRVAIGQLTLNTLAGQPYRFFSKPEIEKLVL